MLKNQSWWNLTS